MKTLLLTIILITPVLCFSQDSIMYKLPIKDGKLIYEEVVEAPGKSKIDLYQNARQWFMNYFKSGKDVIQNEDKEQGQIIGKGIIPVYMKVFGMKKQCDDRITIQVDAKDGKYRYRVYDMVVSTQSGYNSMTGYMPSESYSPESMINKVNGTGRLPYSKGQCKKILESIDTETKSTIASLKKTMSDKTDTF